MAEKESIGEAAQAFEDALMEARHTVLAFVELAGEQEPPWLSAVLAQGRRVHERAQALIVAIRAGSRAAP